MPDAYVHIRTARAALTASGQTLPCTAAYEMGANGPDPLFSYEILLKQPVPDLAALAGRIHREKAGAFLSALVRNAKGSVQRSFAAGFVLHNTLDSLAHPYIAALTAEGACYAIPNGHCAYEAALDCAYYRTDTQNQHALPQLFDICPTLSPAELGNICALLRTALLDVFGAEVPLLALSDSYRWFYWMRRCFPSRFGFKKQIAKLYDALAKKPNFASAHMLPKTLRNDLPTQWRDPYTGEQHRGGMAEILPLAEQLGAVRIAALVDYWNGALTLSTLENTLGNASYDTGLPCA